MDLNKKEFESKCIEVIESIILSNINYTRANAITVSSKMLEIAKEKKCPQGVLDIYTRVLEEFKLASDKEYEILKQQLFKNKD
ncbi:MAG: hypothetical protein J6Q15_00285 [Clostridia bacterium]|nr:hypothetical protein [Clostridia bacterium]